MKQFSWFHGLVWQVWVTICFTWTKTVGFMFAKISSWMKKLSLTYSPGKKNAQHQSTARKWKTFRTAARLLRRRYSSKFTPKSDQLKKTEQVWLWRVPRRLLLPSKNNMAAYVKFAQLHLYKPQVFWNNVLCFFIIYSSTFGENQTQHISTNTLHQLSARWWRDDDLGSLQSLSRPWNPLYTKLF